jgi:type I restriction enzyme S subunit
MTPQELKNSILQLAIQGKLVEQRPEEGTGQELYQQIQAEKQRLIKEGKIKKERPLPEISEDEIPFDIPESWKWVYIGDLFQHNTGKALNSSDKSGIPLEYITTSNVYWNRFELGKLKTMLFTDAEIEKCTVQKGDLLVLEGGDIGRAAIWNYDFPMRIQNHIHRLRPFNEICIEFFYYIFFLYKNAGLINGKGIGIQGLSSKVLHKLSVPLPPLAEQKRIVAKIEELLPYIERYEKAWNKLEELNKRFPTDLQKSILQLAIQGKLVEQRPEEGTAEELYQQIQAEKQRLIKEGKIKKEKPLPEITEDEIPFDIPESWKWVRVSSIVTLNPKNDIHDDTEVGFVPMPLVSDGFKNQQWFYTLC